MSLSSAWTSSEVIFFLQPRLTSPWPASLMSPIYVKFLPLILCLHNRLCAILLLPCVAFVGFPKVPSKCLLEQIKTMEGIPRSYDGITSFIVIIIYHKINKANGERWRPCVATKAQDNHTRMGDRMAWRWPPLVDYFSPVHSNRGSNAHSFQNASKTHNPSLWKASKGVINPRTSLPQRCIKGALSSPPYHPKVIQ